MGTMSKECSGLLSHTATCPLPSPADRGHLSALTLFPHLERCVSSERLRPTAFGHLHSHRRLLLAGSGCWEGTPSCPVGWWKSSRSSSAFPDFLESEGFGFSFSFSSILVFTFILSSDAVDCTPHLLLPCSHLVHTGSKDGISTQQMNRKDPHRFLRCGWSCTAANPAWPQEGPEGFLQTLGPPGGAWLFHCQPSPPPGLHAARDTGSHLCP